MIEWALILAPAALAVLALAIVLFGRLLSPLEREKTKDRFEIIAERIRLSSTEDETSSSTHSPEASETEPTEQLEVPPYKRPPVKSPETGVQHPLSTTFWHDESVPDPSATMIATLDDLVEGGQLDANTALAIHAMIIRELDRKKRRRRPLPIAHVVSIRLYRFAAQMAVSLSRILGRL